MRATAGIECISDDAIMIETSSEDKIIFNCSGIGNEEGFHQNLKNRDDYIVIFSNDDVPGNKLMMKFGKERLYVKIIDDLFGVIINDSYTYD